MDLRRILIALALSGLVLLGWNRLVVQPAIEQRQKLLAEQQKAAEEKADRDRRAAASRPAPDADAPVEAPRPGQPAQPVVERQDLRHRPADRPKAIVAELPKHPREQVQLGSLAPDSGYFMRATLTTEGAAVKYIELNGHRDLETGEPLKVIHEIKAGGRLDPRWRRSFQTAIHQIDGELAAHGTSLNEVDWELDDPPAGRNGPRSTAVFRYQPPGERFVVEKHYRIERIDPAKRDLEEAREEVSAGYELRMTLVVRNLSSDPENVSYEFLGPVGLPLENVEYARKFSDFKIGVVDGDGVDLESLSVGHVVEAVGEAREGGRGLSQDEANRRIQEWQRRFRWAGVDVQFFAGLVMPQGDEKLIAEVRPWLVKQETKVDHSQLSALFTSDAFPLETGDELRHEYVLFAGPKHQDLLATYQAGETIEFGWSVITPFSKAMLWLLSVFHDGLGLHYALAIVCLTLLVRGAMFPLSKKQALSAARMKELQPQIQEIKKKYGDDKQKLAQAQMELFRKANYNPFAGCLPIFLQLPIFIGLYNGLYCAVDLRGASFLWIENLAAPDALFRFPWGSMWVLGPYFNVLPIVTVVLFIIQQKMFMPPPAPDDEQAKMTQRMMNFMMVFMGFIFYGVPAGLCIYFIASSLWSIGERKLLERVKKREPAADEPAPAAAAAQPARKAAAAAQNGDRKKGFWSKLLDVAEAAQAQRADGKAARDANGADRPPDKPAPRPPRKKRGKKSRRR